MKHIRPDIGDAAMPLSCYEKRESDYTGVLVIAGVWLDLVRCHPHRLRCHLRDRIVRQRAVTRKRRHALRYSRF